MFEKDELLCQNIIHSVSKIINIAKDFENSVDLEKSDVPFDSVLMNFIVIGEMANKLSGDLRASTPEIEWSKIISFRNFIAHDYFGIDAEEVWQIIQGKLPLLKVQITELLSKE